MSKKLNNYTVMVDIKLSTDVEIKADSFEQAIEEAKKLAVTDIVEFEGNFNDGEVEVMGVYK